MTVGYQNVNINIKIKMDYEKNILKDYLKFQKSNQDILKTLEQRTKFN